jgi:CheY-like chemotaxis protein
MFSFTAYGAIFGMVRRLCMGAGGTRMSSIVVVDDQRASRRVISKLASTVEPGAFVTEFANPLEALSHLSKHTPDLLITDFSMPFIDGAELIRRFRGMPECGDVPAVVVTAHQNPEFRRLSFEAGTTDYLSLPLNYDEFRLRSRNLLALRRAHCAAAVGQAAISVGVSPMSAGPEEIEGTDAQIVILDGLLQTVSSRLVAKITQLEAVCADLQNVLTLSRCAAVFIDEHLCVRRFTRAISTIYPLSSDDVGRSLLGVQCDLNYPELVVDVMSAKLKSLAIERTVGHRNGDYYAVRIVPNKGREEAPWGAVIYFSKLATWYQGTA